MVTAILPELLLTAGAIVLLLLPFLRSARSLVPLSFALIAVAAAIPVGLLLRGHSLGGALFSGVFMFDKLTFFFQELILLSVGLVVMTVAGDARSGLRDRREFYCLLLLTTVGLLLMPGAQNLVLLYLALELVSVLSYLLSGFKKQDGLSVEAALKYLLVGLLSTGVLLYGISLIYGLAGTMDIRAIPVEALRQSPAVTLAALILLAVGFGFKLSLVPFHGWAPDLYEGAPAPVVSFISVAPKIATFAVLIRLFMVWLSPIADLWAILFSFLAVITMTVGNLAALPQTNLKRLLAYSSIAHAGTMLIGLAAGTAFGAGALAYYAVAYLLMNTGLFMAVTAMESAEGRSDLAVYSGLAQREPTMAALMAVCLLSLGGIPPLAGFFGKMWVFGAALKGNLAWLAVAGAVNSVIAAFYYLKVVKTLYLDPLPAGCKPIPCVESLCFGMSFCVVMLFVLGLWQGPLLEILRLVIPSQLPPGSVPW